MLLAAVVFLLVFAVVSVAVGLGFLYDENRRKEKLRGFLKTVNQVPSARSRAPLLMLPDVNRDSIGQFLQSFPAISWLGRLTKQANLKWPNGRLPLFIMAGAIAGSAAALHFVAAAPLPAGAILGLLGAAAPVLYVLRRRSKLIAAFEEQLPEALDFLARSLRAGHGFAIGLELLATDSPEPLASAFRRVANELQLGSSLQIALARLVEAVPLVDVRFFVSSVLLQQETGGNLSEILAKLSHIIRERFRLRGQVKAVSAHGRITGMILLLMPVVVALVLFVSSPEYLFILLREKEGRYMLWGALGGQVLAYFTIRKIVNIEV